MRRMRALLMAVGMAATAMTVYSAPSRAENGEIAAGIIGGLAVVTAQVGHETQEVERGRIIRVRRQHLAAIQYALGDLKADDSPSEK